MTTVDCSRTDCLRRFGQSLHKEEIEVNSINPITNSNILVWSQERTTMFMEKHMKYQEERLQRFSPWVQWQRTERRDDLQLEISEAASYFKVKIEHFIFVSNLYIPASITIIRKITLYNTRDLIWCWKMHFQHGVAALKHHKRLVLPVHKHVLYAESFNMHPIE